MFAINRAFNDNGEMTKEELSAKETGITNTFAYNENGQPSQTVLTSIRSIDYGYDSNDRLKSRTLSSNTPVAETFTYNSDDAVSTHRVSDGTRDNTYSYTYSDNGNITQIKKDNAVIKSYVYDNSNQLVRENDAENNRTVTYSYDNGGNITSKSVYAYTTGTLGTPTSTKNYTYDSTWKDKLTSYGGQSITYDAIGNPTNYMGATMTWFGRQLQSYTKGNTTVTYKYDADGLRTQKIVNGVQYDYFYVDGQLMYEKIGNDCEMFYRYDPDGRLGLVLKCDIADGAKHYYYPVTNSRGDIMEIHNGPGQITAKYNYDAWGKLLSVTDANGNVLPKTHFAYKISVRYRGYEYDSETGLYYLQSRYYDPETGRFINADDAEYILHFSNSDDLSKNIFVYCRNLPVILCDKKGKNSFLASLSVFHKVASSGLMSYYFEKYDKNIVIKLDSDISKKIKDDKAREKRENDVKDTKGGIAIDFKKNKFGEYLYDDLKAEIGLKEACRLLAAYARAKFKRDFATLYNNKKRKKENSKGYQKKREFLFSEEGVSNEIYQHLLGYMWTIGKKNTPPPHMYAWATINNFHYYTSKNYSLFWKGVRNNIKGATEVADITETDVVYNGGEGYSIKSEAWWYDYFNNISSVYKGTAFDPYYNTKTKKRDKNNNMKAWLGRQLK